MEEQQMKQLSILGVILVTLGILLATGVDQNPVQALPALLLTGAGAWAFNRAERIGNEQSGRTMPIEQGSTDKDAAA